MRELTQRTTQLPKSRRSLRPTIFKLTHAAFWLAMILWVAALVTAAIAATFAFTILPDLNLSMETFRALEQSEHGRVAAGKLMEPIFFFVDMMQVIAALALLVVVAIELLVFRLPVKRISNAIRLLLIVAAMSLLGYRAAAVMPEMNRDLQQYWSAAEAGDADVARQHREAFDRMHPTASRLFSLTLLCVVGAAALTPWAIPPVRPE